MRHETSVSICTPFSILARSSALQKRCPALRLHALPNARAPAQRSSAAASGTPRRRFFPAAPTGGALRTARLIRGLLAAFLLSAPALAAPAATAAASPAPVRLAVLATESAAGTAMLADLLTVSFGQTPGVETVERAELDRVLGEQALTAAGLADGVEGRVAIGRLLRADGSSSSAESARAGGCRRAWSRRDAVSRFARCSTPRTRRTRRSRSKSPEP